MDVMRILPETQKFSPTAQISLDRSSIGVVYRGAASITNPTQEIKSAPQLGDPAVPRDEERQHWPSNRHDEQAHQPPTSRDANGMEMLCDAAAAIVADLQGHGDKNVAMASLGCGGTANCLVKNVKVFDVMNQIP
jgi:hypothetical protein